MLLTIICMDPWRGHIILFVTFIIAHGVCGDIKLIHKWNVWCNCKNSCFFFSYLPQFELFYIVRHILLLWIDRIRRKPQAREEYWWKRLSLLTLRVQLVKLATRHCAPNPTCIVIIVGLYFKMYHQINYWDLDTRINVWIR